MLTKVFFVALALVASCLVMVVIPAAPASALTSATQVSTSNETTCVIVTGGSAYCWGVNAFGQLANGTTSDSRTPVLISGGYTWASISVGTEFVCGVTTAGAGYCWGHNFVGELGDGTRTDRLTPTAVAGGHTWAKISAGYEDSCGVTTLGAGYCWGYNVKGASGNGNTTENDSPAAVSGGYTWSSITTGESSECGVTTAGTGYCWGWNDDGQVGNGNNTDTDSPVAISGAYTWASVSAGFLNSCGLTTAGVGYCWGANDAGQLGNNTLTNTNTPAAVSGGLTWSTVITGYGASCGITTVNTSYCWGYNHGGQIGDGTNTTRKVPTPLAGSPTFTSITNGPTMMTDDTNCGIAQDGALYCWGADDSGQIGDGGITSRNIPTRASLLFGLVSNTVLSVTVDPSFTFAVNGQASNTTCNGIAAASVTSTSATVPFGHLAAGARAYGVQQLEVSTNAGGGYMVYLHSTAGSANVLKGAGTHVINDSGSGAVPGAGNTFFGYSTDSTTAAITSGNILSVPQSGGNDVVGNGSAGTNVDNCVAFAVGVSATTPADTYQATMVYTAVPSF